MVDKRRIKEIKVYAKKYKGFKEGAIKALKLSGFI
jgi:hypothetical protein